MKSNLLMVSMAVKSEHRILRWTAGVLGLAVVLLVVQHWWRLGPPRVSVPSEPVTHSAADHASAPDREIPDGMDTLARPSPSVADVAGTSPGDAPSDDARMAELAYTYPAFLLDLTGASPAIENGRFIGLRVAPNADPTLLSKLGLETGDILMAVNGVTLESLDQAIAVLDMFSGSGRLTFTVRRDDQIMIAG